MDPILLIPYTIWLLTMTGLWMKDETISIKDCLNQTPIVHKQSVYVCREDQRLCDKPECVK